VVSHRPHVHQKISLKNLLQSRHPISPPQYLIPLLSDCCSKLRLVERKDRNFRPTVKIRGEVGKISLYLGVVSHITEPLMGGRRTACPGESLANKGQQRLLRLYDITVWRTNKIKIITMCLFRKKNTKQRA